MNLVHIHIENFKQFVDPLDIEIPTPATVGVIGVNGVGKTTLFQAIEWCLYNPPAIASKDIRPRGRSGNPKVAVTLESNDGTTRWLIERELKRSTTTAVIYRIDADGEEMVVQGTRDVTSYVANKLIDLSHRAFVATFFTRQKELHFFGDVKDTERRREVGKLLGLETIRDAQSMIGDERTSKLREAQAFEKLYEEEISGRDLDAEMAAVTQQVTEAGMAHFAALTALNNASLHTATTGANLEAIQAKQSTYTEIRNRRDRARQMRTSAANSHQERLDTIARLEQVGIRRQELLPIANQRSMLDQKVAALDIERERFQRRLDLERHLQTNIRQRQQSHAAIAADVSRLALPAEGISGWHWNDADSSDPAAGFARLQHIADAWPVHAAESRLNAFTLAHNAAISLQRAEKRLHDCLTLRDKLTADRAQLVAGSDPAEQLQRIATLHAGLENDLRMWATSRERLRIELDKQQRLIDNLGKADFGEGCPTCGRAFSEADATDAIATFRQVAHGYECDISTGDQEAEGNRKSLEELQQSRIVQEQRLTGVRELDSRIQKSAGVISEQEATVESARSECERAFVAAGLTAAPSQHDLDTTAADLQLARAMHQVIDRAGIHISTMQQLAREAARIESDLEPLSDARFDEELHRALNQQRNEAISAQSRIEEFDRQLRELPKVMADRDAQAVQIAELDTVIARLETELAEVGFQPEHLTAAIAAVKQAEEQERTATSQERAQERIVRDSEFRQKQLETEHQRIRQREIDARSRRREADELTQMYTLFSEFEQYVVSRLTPALSEMTSELVRQVTDGKYDDVTFDDNFGIMVADGEELPFPLATFSGGERDAIALCARLALSQMIGQQASEQPGFLVLDEVFGSLDRERRTRLLELFGSLSTISDNFRQVFIISHVDDVRTAPVLDELWLIKESDQGVSTLESLPMGSDIGEL